ncbi:RcnB family protein [Novosphingobium sp.]|uniref:RcnB family protein n=1 Tax=Novosphingobium sp. TaxID=1874826 RepID=UPI0035AF7D23
MNKLAKTGRRSALALALAAMVLPGIAAAAEPGGEDRGGWRGRGGEAREAPGNIGASGWQRPAPQPMPERSWAGNGNGDGGNRGGWARPEAAPRPVAAPIPAPAPVVAPPPGANLGDRGQRGGWNGQSGGGNRGGWDGGRTGRVDPAPAPAPAPAPQQRWNGAQDNRGGAGWNRPAENRSGWSGGNRDGNRDNYRTRDGNRERSRDGDRWRGNDWNRGNTWNGNRGWNGSRYSYNQDYRRWDNRWRSNSRYDWHSYRRGNPQIYRLQPYYSPYRGYSYRRLSIGFFLDSLFFSQNYWINDPWQYRLPDVYGPYRWVRYYDDALLVNIYSGEVVDVINDFFW